MILSIMFKSLKALFVNPRKQTKKALAVRLATRGVHELGDLTANVSNDDLVHLVSELREEGVVEGAWFSKPKLKFIVHSKKQLSDLLETLKETDMALETASTELGLGGNERETALLLKRNKVIIHNNSRVMHPVWLRREFKSQMKSIDVDQDELQDTLTGRNTSSEMLEALVDILPSVSDIAQQMQFPISLVKEFAQQSSTEITDPVITLMANDLVVPTGIIPILFSHIVETTLESEPEMDLKVVASKMGVSIEYAERVILELLNAGELLDFQYLATEGLLRHKFR